MTDVRQLLHMLPMRGGLATAGKRSTIDEKQLWEAVNLYPDLDGMIRTRPGLVQWGQTITEPDAATPNTFHEVFGDLLSWDVTNATSGNVANASQGMLSLSMSAVTDSSITVTRTASNTSAGGDYALKFTLRLFNPRGAGLDDGGQLRVRVSGDGGTVTHTYTVDATGVLIAGLTGLQYVPVYGLDLGGAHTLAFYHDATANTIRIEVDGVLGDPIATTGITTTGSVTTVELYTSIVTATYSDKSWTAQISDLQYANAAYDADDLPFVPQRIIDVGQFIRPLDGSSTKNILLAATSSRLYADVGAVGAWRPITSVRAGHTFMLPFQNKLLLFDDDGGSTSRVRAWDGSAPPVDVTDAPPVRFGTSHRSRLWGAGDRNFPHRLYFTASRNYETWFAPEVDSDETVEEVLNAGYITVDAETGDSVLGVYGEFYGSLIVQSAKGLWRVTGSSPQSFQMENISRAVGGASPRGMVQLGNDLYCVGRSGVVSVQTAQTSGEFQTGMPSGAIADKWSSLPSIADRVDKTQLSEAYFATLPALNLAVLGMRGQGRTVMDQMMVFSPVLEQWCGPWSVNATCFAQVDLGTPVTELLMHGHEDGKVTITGLGVVDDMGTPVSYKMGSAMLNGRTVDPALSNRVKLWRTLRIFVLPRVNSDITVTWYTDLNDVQSFTVGQDTANGPSLSDDFRLDIDRLRSAEDVGVIEIILDASGRYLHFEITGLDPLLYQGCQVSFMPGDQEVA